MFQSYDSHGAYGGEAPVEEYEDEDEFEIKKQGQLSCWGNQQSMNLNPLILTNITGSPYFKVQLFNIKVWIIYIGQNSVLIKRLGSMGRTANDYILCSLRFISDLS